MDESAAFLEHYLFIYYKSLCYFPHKNALYPTACLLFKGANVSFRLNRSWSWVTSDALNHAGPLYVQYTFLISSAVCNDTLSVLVFCFLTFSNIPKVWHFIQNSEPNIHISSLLHSFTTILASLLGKHWVCWRSKEGRQRGNAFFPLHGFLRRPY